MESSPSWKRWQQAILVGLLLALFAWLSCTASNRWSLTFDEIAHITGGYSYWTQNDYRLNPEAGNWIQRWLSLPLVTARCRFPSLDQTAWRTSNLWVMGDALFFGSGSDVAAITRQCRAMALVLAIAVGVLIYAWSRSLFGPTGGLLSLGLYTFSPTVLGNGSLAVSDLPAAGLLAASTWALWRLMHRISWTTLGCAGLTLSGLWLTKLSALLILPIAVILGLIRILGKRPLEWRIGWTTKIRSPGRQTAALVIAAAGMIFIVWICVWSSFGWRYSPYAPGRDTGSHLMEEPAAPSGPLVAVERSHILPRAYVYGLSYMFRHSDGRRSFLNGEFSNEGWARFYPYCLLVKNSLWFFDVLLVAITALAFLRHHRTTGGEDESYPAYDVIPLGVLLAIYGEAAVTSHIDIGNRHILPIYVAVFVLGGSAALWVGKPARRSWVQRVFIVLLGIGIVGYVADAMRIRPEYLAYFNRIAGGPEKGYRHLVDSSLDWGQSLPALRGWLTSHPGDSGNKVYLSYFGSADPGAYGVNAIPLPSFLPSRNTASWPIPLQAGDYCISATMLQPVYHDYPGPWNAAYETLWQETRAWYGQLSTSTQNVDDQQRLLAKSDGDTLRKCLRQYEQLRFSRLCAYLRKKEPVAQPGYSILVYRLTDDDVRQAVFGPPLLESDHPATEVIE